jgi:acetyltransferase-like isoleucine patch superfamily enzyme
MAGVDRRDVAFAIDDDVVIGYPTARTCDPRVVIGPGARLRTGTVVYEGSRIGAMFECGHHVVIREQNQIGDDVSIWSNTVIDYGCVIHDRVKIHANCYIAQFTEIGEDAFLAPGVTIANDLYPGFTISAERMRGPIIGAGAQIGVNVTILPYVRIGTGVIIGAGSVVTKDVPDRTIAFGSPAVPVRDRPDDDLDLADAIMRRANGRSVVEPSVVTFDDPAEAS